MYRYAHDEGLALAVWRFERTTAGEWQEHFDHLRDVARWHARTGKRVAAIVVASRLELPSSELRATLTALTDAPGYDPYVAFVAPNDPARLVLTVFSWLQKTPQYETKYVSGAEAGIAWLESKRGEPLPALRPMVERVVHSQAA